MEPIRTKPNFPTRQTRHDLLCEQKHFKNTLIYLNRTKNVFKTLSITI